jgi:hypothetical protein
LCRPQPRPSQLQKGTAGLLSILFAHRLHTTYLGLHPDLPRTHTHNMSRPRTPTHTPYLSSPERPQSKRTSRWFVCRMLKPNGKVCGRHFTTLQGFKSHLRSPRKHAAAVDGPATPQRGDQAPPLTDGPSSLLELLLLIETMSLGELVELHYQGAPTITLHFSSLPPFARASLSCADSSHFCFSHLPLVRSGQNCASPPSGGDGRPWRGCKPRERERVHFPHPRDGGGEPTTTAGHGQRGTIPERRVRSSSVTAMIGR